MKIKFAVFFFAVLFNSVIQLNAQSNSLVTIGNDSLTMASHIRTNDKGIIIGSVRTDLSQICFIKLDSAFSLEWTLSTSISGGFGLGVGCVRMKELGDGSVVALLSSSAFVLRLSASGSLIWKRNYTDINNNTSWYSNYLYDIMVTDSNTIIVAGTKFEASAGAMRAWMQCMDSLGAVLWSYDYSTLYSDQFSCLTKTRDGGFTVIGHSTSSLGVSSAFVIHFSLNGIVQWITSYEFSPFSYFIFNKIIETQDNSYLIVGTDNDSMDGFLIQFDSSGTFEWLQVYGDSNTITFNDVIETDTGYVICGNVSPFVACGRNGLIVSCDKLNGTLQWQAVTADQNNPVQDPVVFSTIESIPYGYLVIGHTGFLAQSIYGTNDALFFTNLTGMVNCYNISHPLNPIPHLSPIVNNLSVNSFQHSIDNFEDSLDVEQHSFISASTCPTGINEIRKEERLLVYPNPSNGVFSLNSKITGGEILIYNLLGDNIYFSKILYPKMEIDLSEKANGIYFLEVSDGENTSAQKIIIQR